MNLCYHADDKKLKEQKLLRISPGREVPKTILGHRQPRLLHNLGYLRTSRMQATACSASDPQRWANMSHDIFVSHSSHDAQVAQTICMECEGRKIATWIAPRDVAPGAEWAESILDALAGSRAVVLVFSSYANESPHVLREVERAVSKRLLIIPFMIENTPPTGTLEYFLSTTHWLNAYTPPLSVHVERLVQLIVSLFSHEGRFLNELNKAWAVIDAKTEERAEVATEVVEPLFNELQPLVDDYFELFRSARSALTAKRRWLGFSSSVAAENIRKRREALLTTRVRVREWANAIRESTPDRALATFATSIGYFFLGSIVDEVGPKKRSYSGKLVDLFEAFQDRTVSKGELHEYISKTLKALEECWQAVARNYAFLKSRSMQPADAADRTPPGQSSF